MTDVTYMVWATALVGFVMLAVWIALIFTHLTSDAQQHKLHVRKAAISESVNQCTESGGLPVYSWGKYRDCIILPGEER